MHDFNGTYSTKRQFAGQLLLAFLLTAVHFLIIKSRDAAIFSFPSGGRRLLFAYGCVILAALVCFCFYAFLLHVIRKLISKDEAFLSYFRYFLFYFVFMGFFWLLTWPGIFKGDEFYVLRSGLSFTMSGAQSGLTSLFYIISLLIFPSLATIVFFQLLIICTLFAIAMHDVCAVLPRSRLRALLFVPFVLLPVIDGNLFTLRATLVGWIFLFVLAELFYLARSRTFSMRRCMLLAVLSGLLCAWRSEYIYLVVLLPLALLLLRLASVKRALIVCVILLLASSALNIPNKIALNGSNKYPISLVLNPVANLFTEAESLKGPQVYEDIMTINELVDVQLLRKTASVRNISQYWNIDDVLPKEQLSSFMKASIRLIIFNPDKFMKYRWQTFAYTNGLYPDRVNHPGGECVDAINRLVYYDTDYKSMFILMQPPLGQSLREKTISLLACRTYKQGDIRTNALLPVFYNCIPVLVLSVVFFLVALLRKNRVFAVLFLLLLGQFPLIFLTAPAMFFMYYFCFYLSGWFLCMLFITGSLTNPTLDPD